MGQTCTKGSSVAEDSKPGPVKMHKATKKSKGRESPDGQPAQTPESNHSTTKADELTNNRTPPPPEFAVVTKIEALQHTMRPTVAVVNRADLHREFRQFTPVTVNGCAALSVVSCQNASLPQQVLMGGEDCSIAQFNYETGHVMRRWVRAHDMDIVGLTRPTATGLFASCSRDSTAKVWNLHRDVPIAVLEGHTLGIAGIDLDPTSTCVVTGSRDNSVRLWDIASGKELSCHDVKQNVATFVRFLPQLNLVAQGAEDLAVRLWDVRVPPAAPVLTLSSVMTDTSHIPLCCDVSPSVFSRLLTGHSGNDGKGGYVQEWDVRTSHTVRTYTGHKGSVRCLRMSSSKMFGDTAFFTASQDGTMGFWSMEASSSTLDVAKLPISHHFAVPEGAITAIECEANGDIIVTLQSGAVVVLRPEKQGGTIMPAKRFRYVGSMKASKALQ